MRSASSSAPGLFGVASETLFRRVCYSLIALAVMIGLPALDALLGGGRDRSSGSC